MSRQSSGYDIADFISNWISSSSIEKEKYMNVESFKKKYENLMNASDDSR